MYESKTYSTVPAGLANYSLQLQLASHEEGRIRAVRIRPDTAATALVWDYMLKDHLGNVRMVLTEEVKSDTYTTLSFEGASGSAEVNNQNAVWENASGQSINVVASRTSSSAVLTNSGLQPPPLSNSLLVRSSTGKIGAGKLVKVMAGDRIHTSVQYYYPSSSGTGTGTGLNTLVGGLASVITNSLSSGTLVKGAGTALANGVAADPAAVGFFANQNNTPAAGRPKAYLNVLFFDEQFKMDATASQYQQVGTGSMAPGNPGQVGFVAGSAVLAQKSGYCYIYISNESDELVYFDNLTLTHERGPLLEETHYYPFGLTMAGISSKAAGTLQNKEKTFQSQRLDDDLGLNWVQFKWRNHDPQIGRFIEIDPLSEKYVHNSTYAFSENKTVSHVELEGLEAVVVITGATLGNGKASSHRGNYFMYRVDIYENMTLEQFQRQINEGTLSSPTATTALARDAWKKGSKRSSSRYGSRNETPPGTYWLSYNQSGYGKHKYKLKVSDNKNSDQIDGVDGLRSGIRIHHYSPHFAEGCLTTGENSAESVEDFISLIPSLLKGEDVRLIIEEREAEYNEANKTFKGTENPNPNSSIQGSRRAIRSFYRFIDQKARESLEHNMRAKPDNTYHQITTNQ